ncbi:spore coat protein [Bacillus sp. WL1]|nr:MULTISPECIES: spore coat protein [unclassified Bacillus (in: firmicutes)]MBP3971441.1 spore coat protein [Bacillus sp. WL1]UOB82061.1 spore coat protein [Bacillus sp. ZJS3]
MNEFIQNITGMSPMTDQVIATDLLLASKTAVRNYAYAITEVTSDQTREVLRQHLHDAIDTHKQVSQYMIDKGYYHPTNVHEQLQVDLTTTQTALNVAQNHQQPLQ